MNIKNGINSSSIKKKKYFKKQNYKEKTEKTLKS